MIYVLLLIIIGLLIDVILRLGDIEAETKSTQLIIYQYEHRKHDETKSE